MNEEQNQVWYEYLMYNAERITVAQAEEYKKIINNEN